MFIGGNMGVGVFHQFEGYKTCLFSSKYLVPVCIYTYREKLLEVWPRLVCGVFWVFVFFFWLSVFFNFFIMSLLFLMILKFLNSSLLFLENHRFPSSAEPHGCLDVALEWFLNPGRSVNTEKAPWSGPQSSAWFPNRFLRSRQGCAYWVNRP